MTPPRDEEIGQYRPQLLRFARQRLADAALAEDAVQEALIAAFQNKHRFAAGSSLGTWLTGILKHKIVDCIRGKARDQWQEYCDDETVEHAHLARPEEPGEALQQRGFFERLEGYIEELPRKAARVFVLREVMGLNTAETCRELAISSTNCSVLLHRAKLRLRSQFATDGFGAGGPG